MGQYRMMPNETTDAPEPSAEEKEHRLNVIASGELGAANLDGTIGTGWHAALVARLEVVPVREMCDTPAARREIVTNWAVVARSGRTIQAEIAEMERVGEIKRARS